jgi:hypothetical protein
MRAKSTFVRRQAVTLTRYNVTARCDTPNHFRFSPAVSLNPSIFTDLPFYRRFFIASVSTRKVQRRLFTLAARGLKSREAFPDKNALTDQYLEERDPSQTDVGTALALDDYSKTAAKFEREGRRCIQRLY